MTALRVALAVALWPFVYIADRLRGVRPAASMRAGIDWARRTRPRAPFLAARPALQERTEEETT